MILLHPALQLQVSNSALRSQPNVLKKLSRGPNQSLEVATSPDTLGLDIHTHELKVAVQIVVFCGALPNITVTSEPVQLP